MNLLTRIMQVVATSLLMMVIVFYFYKLYNPDTSKRDANPYLYNYKYYNPASKEEMSQLIDKLTNYDQSYDEQFYSRKGKFSDSGLSREFRYDKTEEITKTIDNESFVRLETSKGYVYCKDEVQVKFGMRTNHAQQKEKFFVRVSWAVENECRKYWWGGKNPIALRDNHQPVR